MWENDYSMVFFFFLGKPKGLLNVWSHSSISTIHSTWEKKYLFDKDKW